MYTFIKEAHSGIAYLLILPLIFIVLFAAYSFFTKQAFTDRHKKFALVGLIVTHLQILLGLILYFISPNGLANFSGESMKSSTNAFDDIGASIDDDISSCVGNDRIFKSEAIDS
jgi:hypothetical protein